MSLDPISIIYRSCDPDLPLPLGDDRYVSLAKARGETAMAPMGWRELLARDIRRLDKPTTFLVAGFAGDGKSTEFARLLNDLKIGDPKLAAIYIDAGVFLNRYEFTFTDILPLRLYQPWQMPRGGNLLPMRSSFMV